MHTFYTGALSALIITASLLNAPIVEAQTNTPSSSACIIITQTLSRGSGGPAVSELQGFLIQAGYLAAGNQTGYFGPLTEQALKDWQITQGFEPVGVVGPKTRKALAECSNTTGAQLDSAATIQTFNNNETDTKHVSLVGATSVLTSATGTTSPSTAITCPPGTYTERSACIKANRTAAWATNYSGWEVLFDGTGMPGDNVPSHLAWDNPVDDDWDDNARVRTESIMFNSPSTGFMTIDRVSNLLDRKKTGHIRRTDEFLTDAAGLTMEFRMKVLPQSTTDGISAQFANDKHSIALYLSPNQLKLAPITPLGSAGVSIPFNTTKDFHTYRLVKYPNSSQVRLYVDNATSPILTADAATTNTTGPKAVLADFPYVLIGDGSPGNGVIYDGAYTLDYARYRRGAFLPGSALTAILRTPPALPAPVTGTETFHEGVTGSALPTVPPFERRGSASAWSLLDDGTMSLKTEAGKTADYLIKAPKALTSKGPMTLEMRFKMLPDAGHRGFSLQLLDELGTVAVSLSKDRVESHLGTKPAAYQTHMTDLTDGFHTLRLVRPANSNYAYVYLDNDPIPVLVDQKIDATRLLPPNVPRIRFGTYHDPRNNAPEAQHGTDIVIDYIRWRADAAAPPVLSGAGLLTCSEDRGKTFKSGSCTSSSVILRWSLHPHESACVAVEPFAGSRWTGEKPSSATQTIEPTPNGSTKYTLSCSNGDTQFSSSVTIQHPTKTTSTVSSSTQTDTPVQISTLQLSITASPDQVAPGGTATINWSATNAQSCALSGPRASGGGTSGSTVTGMLGSSATYTLTCKDTAGTNHSKSVTVTVPTSGAKPVVDLMCTNYPALSFHQGPCTGGVAVMRWTQVQNATICEAIPPFASSKWTGPKPLSATQTVESGITSSRTYTIACYGPGGETRDSVTIGQ